MHKKIVYQRNKGRKEGQNSYMGTNDQGNRLGIGIHRQLTVQKKENFVYQRNYDEYDTTQNARQ